MLARQDVSGKLEERKSMEIPGHASGSTPNGGLNCVANFLGWEGLLDHRPGQKNEKNVLRRSSAVHVEIFNLTVCRRVSTMKLQPLFQWCREIFALTDERLCTLLPIAEDFRNGNSLWIPRKWAQDCWRPAYGMASVRPMQYLLTQFPTANTDESTEKIREHGACL